MYHLCLRRRDELDCDRGKILGHMVKNFLKLSENIIAQVQELLWVSSIMRQRKSHQSTWEQSCFRKTKTQKNLKSRQKIYDFKGETISLRTDLSLENSEVRGNAMKSSKGLKEISANLEFLTQIKVSFKNEDKMKAL